MNTITFSRDSERARERGKREGESVRACEHARVRESV